MYLLSSNVIIRYPSLMFYRSVWSTLCAKQSQDCVANPWIVLQTMDPGFAQDNPGIVQIHSLHVTYYILNFKFYFQYNYSNYTIHLQNIVPLNGIIQRRGEQRMQHSRSEWQLKSFVRGMLESFCHDHMCMVFALRRPKPVKNDM